MPATRADINGWLDRLYDDENVTHMIVKCDTFDYRGNPGDKCCYPVYVDVTDDVRTVEAENKDKTQEVYSASHTREEQMAEGRAFHYD
jgi:hypothetical protein